MKTSISFGVFALLIMGSFSSCILFNHEPDINSYELALNFQDASGNDLVKGIISEDSQSSYVSHNLFVLNIIASQACEDLIAENRHFVPDAPRLWLNKMEGVYFLMNSNGYSEDYCHNEKVVTYKLTCPYIFGDKEEHDIVTYWDLPKKKRGKMFTEATCNRVEFEGKTYTPATTDTYYKNKVIIVLDR